MHQDTDIRQRFEAALEALLAKVRQDRTIIAALLGGSLAYDQVWAKSDIDIWLITKDEKRTFREYCLVEDDINIHCNVLSRSNFKSQVEQALQSSFLLSFLSKCTLLFSADPTIGEYFAQIRGVGDHDRQIQLMRLGTDALPILYKAEKWLRAKHDATYSVLWVMFLLNELAMIEVVSHGEVASREVINQALRHNPSFFNAVYHDLLYGPKDAAAVDHVLRLIDSYLTERIPLLFRPILEYLHESGGVRTTTELNSYFQKRAHLDRWGLQSAYEWLADKNVIQKIATPMRLTEKSRVTVNEAAYYYDKEEQQ